MGDRQNVTDGESSLLTAVDESTGVETFGSDEGLGTELVAVLVTENDTSQRSTTASVVDDLLDYTTDVAVTLSIVVSTELGWGLVVVGVRLENTTVFTLRSDDSTPV